MGYPDLSGNPPGVVIFQKAVIGIVAASVLTGGGALLAKARPFTSPKQLILQALGTRT